MRYSNLTPKRSLRWPYLAALIASLGLFAGGIVMGNLLHLAACPLCIIQRMLYLLVAITALIGLLLARSRAGRITGSVLMLASSGTGAFVAGYQSYLQHHPTGIGCAVNSPWWEDLVFWAGEKLPLFFQAGGVCEDSSWKLFGLSIAEYSVIAFAGLTVLAIYPLFRRST